MELVPPARKQIACGLFLLIFQALSQAPRVNSRAIKQRNPPVFYRRGFSEELQKLCKDAAKFFCTGNHAYLLGEFGRSIEAAD
jgi:hypothetical protein